MIAGVDEAGRGSLVGPLVISIVAGDGDVLSNIGVRDSKTLTPRAREVLYSKIVNVAACVNYIAIEPYVVDAYTYKRGLNTLELVATVELIKLCPAAVYYVDSPDVNVKRYENRLKSMAGVEVVAVNRGESIPQVAAASIVAKVTRDRYVAMLKREFGEFGSGYPSDKKTREWVTRGLIPLECVRQSWRTFGKLFK